MREWSDSVVAGVFKKYEMMIIRVRITKEILEETKDCSEKKGFISQTCAVAVAVKELFPNAQVNGSQLDPWIGPPNREERLIELPSHVRKFIQQFDRSTSEERIRMEPISFDIQLTRMIIGAIGEEKVNHILLTSKTLERV